MLHLFAHNQENKVKVGDEIKTNQVIGTVGNANGAYYSHLHYSISEGLIPTEIKSYVSGWSQEKVEKYYIKPDEEKTKEMFNEPVDVGNMGYGWLDSFGSGLHPGVDVNGLGGGNTDMGYEFKSPIDGEVIASEDWGTNWGNIIIIKEKTMSNDNYDQFKKALEDIADSKDFDYGKNMNGNEAEKLAKEVVEDEPSVCDTEEIEQQLKDCQEEVNRLNRLLASIKEIVC